MGSVVVVTASHILARMDDAESDIVDITADVTALQAFSLGNDIGDAVDLNTLTTPGLYIQSNPTYATNGSNYPEDVVGMLEVFSNANTASGSHVWQRFTPADSAGERVWIRNKNAGAWTPWRVMRFGVMQTISAYGEATVSVAGANSGFISHDISSWGFTQPPGFSHVCHNFSYFPYRAAGGTHSKDYIPLGVRHFLGTSATTDVDVTWQATGI